MSSPFTQRTSAPIPPACKALCIQLVAVALAAILLLSLKSITGISIGLIAAATIAGVFAALLSHWFRLDWWWLPIQLGFTPALILFNSLAVPPLAFLVAFLLMLAVFWSTYRTRVPLFSSGPAVWDAVAALLPAHALRGIDIGSGVGGAVLALSEQRRDCAFTGIELAPLPWLISVIRARWRRSSARFIRSDYAKLDLGAYDVVFAYLSPAAMPALWEQARQQMRPGTMLISYEFGLEHTVADAEHQPAENGPMLYVWYPNGKHHI